MPICPLHKNMAAPNDSGISLCHSFSESDRDNYTFCPSWPTDRTPQNSHCYFLIDLGEFFEASILWCGVFRVRSMSDKNFIDKQGIK